MNPVAKKVARSLLKIAGAAGVLIGAIWLLFAAGQWIQVRLQASHDVSAMGWFHAFVREELPRYYEKHGFYPTNLQDVLQASYGQRAVYGDNFRTNMLSRIVYTSDGKSFKFTWSTPEGKQVVLSGESGQIITNSW